MKLRNENVLILGVCALYGLSLHSGLFDRSYKNSIDEKLRNNNDSGQLVWILIHILLLLIFLNLLRQSRDNALTRKITGVDWLFVSSFLGFTLLLTSCSLLKRALPMIQNDKLPQEIVSTLVARVTAFGDWVALPLQLWIVAWSKCVRKGWNSRHALSMVVTSSSVFCFTIIHQTMFSFLLLIGCTLSCIALYELYKIHFFRPRVKIFFWMSLISNVVFCGLRAFESAIFGANYLATILFGALFTSSVTLLFSNISIDVNSHK